MASHSAAALVLALAAAIYGLCWAGAAAGVTGAYTVVMEDSFCDGWHGGRLEIVDVTTGEAVFSGDGPPPFSFDYYDYSTTSCVVYVEWLPAVAGLYTAQFHDGDWHAEVSWRIKDPGGVTLAEGGAPMAFPSPPFYAEEQPPLPPLPPLPPVPPQPDTCLTDHAPTDCWDPAILSGCIVVNSLVIEGELCEWADADIELAVLHNVRSDLTVFKAGGLSSLSLPALATVGGGLNIQGNDQLASLSLPALATVGFSVYIEGNDQLALLLLPALDTVGAVYIGLNDQLASLSLTALATVGFLVYIEGNDQLASLSLPALATVGAAYIRDNDQLASLTLPALATVESIVYISSNDQLASLSLTALATVGGHVAIRDNDQLASLSLPGLATVGDDVDIWSNDQLTSLSLPALATVGGYVDVDNNDQLASLSLTALAIVGGYVDVFNNDQLASLSLPALAAVRGYVLVENNDQLASLSLTALATVGGYMDVYNNDQLASLSLPALATVRGYVRISDNDQLASLSLTALAIVVDAVYISFNYQLAWLSLPALATVGDQVSVRDNDQLASLSLAALAAVGNDLKVYSNGDLANATVRVILNQTLQVSGTVVDVEASNISFASPTICSNLPLDDLRVLSLRGLGSRSPFSITSCFEQILPNGRLMPADLPNLERFALHGTGVYGDITQAFEDSNGTLTGLTSFDIGGSTQLVYHSDHFDSSGDSSYSLCGFWHDHYAALNHFDISGLNMIDTTTDERSMSVDLSCITNRREDNRDVISPLTYLDMHGIGASSGFEGFGGDFGEFPALQHLDFGGNHFDMPLPTYLTQHPRLTALLMDGEDMIISDMPAITASVFPALERLSLPPSITSLVIDADDSDPFVLPSLREIAIGSLEISPNSTRETIVFNELASIAGSLVLSGVPACRAFVLPVLTSVGGVGCGGYVSITHNDNLTLFSAPALGHVGVASEANDAGQSSQPCVGPASANDAPAPVPAPVPAPAPAPASASEPAPEPTPSAVEISDNPALDKVIIGVMASITEYNVRNNPRLRQADLTGHELALGRTDTPLKKARNDTCDAFTVGNFEGNTLLGSIIAPWIGKSMCEGCPSGYDFVYNDGQYVCEEDWDEISYILALMVPLAATFVSLVTHAACLGWRRMRVPSVYCMSRKVRREAITDTLLGVADVVTDAIFIFLVDPSCDWGNENAIVNWSHVFLWAPMGLSFIRAAAEVIRRTPAPWQWLRNMKDDVPDEETPCFATAMYSTTGLSGGQLVFCDCLDWLLVPTSAVMLLVSSASLGAIRLLPWQDGTIEAADKEKAKAMDRKLAVLTVDAALEDNDGYPDYQVDEYGGPWHLQWFQRMLWFDWWLTLVEDVGQIVLQSVFLASCIPGRSSFIATSVSLVISALRLAQALWKGGDRIYASLLPEQTKPLDELEKAHKANADLMDDKRRLKRRIKALEAKLQRSRREDGVVI